MVFAVPLKNRQTQLMWRGAWSRLVDGYGHEFQLGTVGKGARGHESST